MTSELPPSAHPRRAVFVLPSLLTVMNLFLGYFSVVQAFQGDFRTASLLIMLAGLLDKLDGLVARATGTTSEFGRELDSLADVISFGVAPAFLSLAWGLHVVPKLGWAVAFLFLTCGVLRLARYNVQAATADRAWFVGLPIPVAAALPVTVIFSFTYRAPQRALEDPLGAWAFLVLMVVASFLMVSRVRYNALKDLRFGRQRRLLVLLASGAVVVSVAAWPAIALPALAAAYAVHGPALRLTRWHSDRHGTDPSPAVVPDAVLPDAVLPDEEES